MRLPTCRMILFALSIFCPSFAAEYLVSPAGDDAQSGSRDAPFRSIQKAADVMVAGDSCLIRGGDYFESVRPAASGGSGAPIVFQVSPGEQATVWGTQPVTAWQRVGDGIWRAAMEWDLGKNNQVFVGGKMATEARWPNVTDEDLLTPEGAAITKGGTNFIQCDSLPDDLTDDAWQDAVLWVLAGAKWTSWSTVIDGYDAETKTLQFDINDQGSIAKNMNPGDRRGGYFYVSGKRSLLDVPGEWCYDSGERMLYLCVAESADPNAMQVTAKRRETTFDLNGRAHIQIKGFHVVGATVAAEDCENCLIQGVRVYYPSHTRGGRTGYGLNEPTGIRISGKGNVIRDAEIAYSAGSGVELGGEGNSVINCWIHDIGYMGSYECPVRTSGWRHLISHNTIHDAGRDCMQPRGQAILIQYNDISRMGRICHDLGASYVVSSDGGGTEFRFNWSHDNLAEGTRMGIYLDNFTSNYFVHHNVCWNTRGDEIRLNKPSLYNVVAHNTMLGFSGNWGRWQTDWMYGCIYASNLLNEDIRPHPQPTLAGNVQHVPEGQLNATNFQTASAGRGKGVVVPGITRTFSGESPDAGAYQTGLPAWKPGHNFEVPPQPVYQLTDTPLRNPIRHGSFDWQQYRGQLGPWQTTDAGAAKIVWGPGGIAESYSTRNTIIGAGVCLQSEETDGIEQVVDGLSPNTEYDLAGWMKVDDAAEIRIGVRGHGGPPQAAATASPEWYQPRLRFTTGPTVTSVTVFVTKQGAGKAYVDDIGLVPVLRSLPMGQPGMVPVNK